jgi:hypothetical protein
MYIGGPTGEEADWINAKGIFELLLNQKRNDGPARTILDVIQRLQCPDGKAPKGWPGHRSLDEK